MNRWYVYEYMKHRYMTTGQVPNLKEVQTEFAGLDPEEIGEGMIEFQNLLKADKILFLESYRHGFTKGYPI